jgi:uncharacterized protein YggU (UPF0235/DUF167 family)
MVRTESVDVKALKTKPPARYTEATLLSAMEGAGKLIDDDELREAMAEKGLGTPATRAQTIEGLILEKYMLRDGRELVPTAKAFQLMTLLRGLAIEDLTKPELTGNWEYQLAEMEHGRLKREAFMAEIAKMAERIVRKAKEYDRDTIPGDYATLATPCPNCGGVVKENYRRFACTGGRRHADGRLRLLHHQDPGRPRLRDRRGRGLPARQEDRPAGGLPLQGRLALHRRAEAGAFDDEINNWKLEFDFGDDAKQAEGDGEPVDFSAQQSLGACPKCKGHVYEHGTSYVCEHAVGAHVTCDFKSGKIILQQPVAREQMSKLLAPARPSLLENFVSNKTRRKFKAYLAYDKKEGKVGFEFEPRAAKVAAKKAAAKKAAAKCRPDHQAPGRRRRLALPDARGGGTLLMVAVQPGARRTGADGLHDGALRCAAGGAAGGRQANEALVAWLADQLGLPQARRACARGATSRRKAVRDRRPADRGALAGRLAEARRGCGPMTPDVFYKLLAIFARWRWAGWPGAPLAGRAPTAARPTRRACSATPPSTSSCRRCCSAPWRGWTCRSMPGHAGGVLRAGGRCCWRSTGSAPAPQRASRPRRGPAVRTIAASYGNAVQLGIPMAAALFGEAGLALHIALVSVHG